MRDLKLKLKPGHSKPRVWMEPAPLRQLCWNVTYACNHRCGICFTDSHAATRNELTTPEALALVRQTDGAGIRDIIISGGEPFVRADIVDILVAMAGRGISARIASNGSLLPAELLDRLRADTLTKSFQISLDSVDPDVYARLHGVKPDALAGVLRAIDRVQERGFHTTVSVRVTDETLPGLPRVLDLACEKGWSTVTLHLPIYTGRSDGAPHQDTDALTLLGPVFDHFLRLPESWLVETYIPWAPYHPVLQRLAERVDVVHCGCAAGRDRLTVNPDGSISPCVCLDVPAAYVGNVRTDDLGEVFAGAWLCDVLRRPEAHGICVDCEHVRSCGGGCRANAYALSGAVDGQDGTCPLLRSGQAKVEAAGHAS